ncbi:MAG: Mrp/NBP35 family ATP-binding protein [Rhodobacteraceae bacterium]|nr:Mrp/NBP35 family ATP-binding protein [Paracoccaceae bacterium]
MTVSTPTPDAIRACLTGIAVPGGGNLISADRVRALTVAEGRVRFVIEAAGPSEAQALNPVVEAAEAALRALPGVRSVQIAVTAEAAPKQPPDLTIGRHPEGGPKQRRIPGVKRILAVGSGKGGVGKSTVSANLAVAMARQGWKVGLLDADIYGPSQSMMMGVTRAPASPDGKTIIPLQAHGICFMSIGNMLPEGQAVIWRGPMLMGALQQLLMQVRWGDLDVLIVDMPPGTGDVHLTLCTHFDVTGALVVSTPQDMALIDAQKALTAFRELKTEVIGLIENMSTYICPNCGHEEHLFGHGGVAREAAKMGLPVLAEIPLTMDVRIGGDSGTPVALTDGPVAEIYGRLAARLIAAAERAGVPA